MPSPMSRPLSLALSLSLYFCLFLSLTLSLSNSRQFLSHSYYRLSFPLSTYLYFPSFSLSTCPINHLSPSSLLSLLSTLLSHYHPISFAVSNTIDLAHPLSISPFLGSAPPSSLLSAFSPHSPLSPVSLVPVTSLFSLSLLSFFSLSSLLSLSSLSSVSAVSCLVSRIHLFHILSLLAFPLSLSRYSLPSNLSSLLKW